MKSIFLIPFCEIPKLELSFSAITVIRNRCCQSHNLHKTIFDDSLIYLVKDNYYEN